jgi:hypothetical protein
VKELKKTKERGFDSAGYCVSGIMAQTSCGGRQQLSGAHSDDGSRRMGVACFARAIVDYLCDRTEADRELKDRKK